MATKEAPTTRAALKKAVVAKTKVAKALLPTGTKAYIQKQIDALQVQMEALNQKAVHELKLKISDARRVVTDLEHELEQLTGKPSSAAPKQRRPRTPSITDEALKDQVSKVMTSSGTDGMNAKQLADKLHQDPIRIRKFIASSPKLLKREGKAAATKFYLA